MGTTTRKERSLVNGFSLIEVVTVLLLLGILAAVVVVRMMDTGVVDLSSQLDVVKNHLRYAQSKALSTGSDWGITFETDKRYFLYKKTDPTTRVPFVGEEDSTVDLEAKKSNLRITSYASVPKIEFDPYGSPGTSTFTVTTNGGDIVVTRNTGYIQ